MISLLLATAALAAPVDFKLIPTAVCPSWEDVSDTAQSCAHNEMFLKATTSCLGKIENLERTLSLPAQAIANSANGAQSGDITSAKQGYQYTSEALTYLIAVAKVGYAQVQEYSLYILPPEDTEGPEDYDEDLSWMDKTECYGGNNNKLEALQKQFGEKIARLEGRNAQAVQYQKSLSGSGTDMGSLTEEVKLGQKSNGVNSKTPKGPEYNSSDISGTEKKRNQP